MPWLYFFLPLLILAAVIIQGPWFFLNGVFWICLALGTGFFWGVNVVFEWLGLDNPNGALIVFIILAIITVVFILKMATSAVAAGPAPATVSVLAAATVIDCSKEIDLIRVFARTVRHGLPLEAA